MPRGALFVSRRITDSKDPFVKWASGYLARRGEPVYALEPKANKHLFVEVSEDELEERLLRSASLSCLAVAAVTGVDNVGYEFVTKSQTHIHASDQTPFSNPLHSNPYIAHLSALHKPMTSGLI